MKILVTAGNTAVPIDRVRVITNRAEYEADSLVITAGAWNNQLLPFLQHLAVPERQVLAWLQPEKPDYFTPERFPVFNLLVDEGRVDTANGPTPIGGRMTHNIHRPHRRVGPRQLVK